jgi:hypothetical protein
MSARNSHPPSLIPQASWKSGGVCFAKSPAPILCHVTRGRLALIAQGEEGNKALFWPGCTYRTRALSQASSLSLLQDPWRCVLPEVGHTPRVRGAKGAGGWLARIYPPRRSRVKIKRKKIGGRKLENWWKRIGGLKKRRGRVLALLAASVKGAALCPGMFVMGTPRNNKT